MDPCCAKRLWRMIRAACCALRRGFSKHKLTMDLHLLFYRGKLAGMSIGNFRTFNHNHQIDPEQDYASPDFFHNPDDVEFSCSNTPFSDKSNSRRRRRRDQPFDVAALTRALLSPDPRAASSSQAAVRQLRITDSPYPAEEEEEVANDGGFVDMKAEEFIRRFREQLLLQLSPPATPEYQLSPPATPEYLLRRLRTPARDGSDPA